MLGVRCLLPLSPLARTVNAGIATHAAPTHIARGNDYGQLGLGDTLFRGNAPVQMGANLPFVDLGAGQNASKLAVGLYHTCALLTGGVKCWG